MTNLPILGIFRKKYTDEFVYKAPHYKEAYEQIIDALQRSGVYVAILMKQDSYLGSGKFNKHWVQAKNSDGSYKFEERGPIAVDALYDKEHFETDGRVLQINDQQLTDICWNKDKTYEVLGEFHPKTLKANNPQELQKSINQIFGDKVAIKQLTGSSGEGVFVGLKADATANSFTFPVLVQEFIDTSAGVPGITNKRHDIRVVLAGGTPIAATLRTPPDGSYKSNIGYGGENRLLNLSDLPPVLVKLGKQIDKKLKNYGKFRLYSIDFGLTPHGWRMFEANSTPGAIAQSRGPQAKIYQKELTRFLKKAAVEGRKLRSIK